MRLGGMPGKLAPEMVEGLVDTLHRKYLHPFDPLLGLVRRGNDGTLEAELRRLAQALLAALYRSDFPRQAHFTKHKQIWSLTRCF